MTTRLIQLLRRIRPRIRRPDRIHRTAREAGMTTAEYAVGTMAAVAFAVVLMAVVKSGAVQSALTTIITTALSSGSS
ncbi:MAG: DUF4244 domain-containing protein [Actinomycetales bacterium]|nr:DUF4244 domain-containing protein [Tetrasphaera sp.]NLW99514.1 DUF4244 domain-containing protein [Actinomycetales bacterium]